jgi:type IV pilus assembly protein PilP
MISSRGFLSILFFFGLVGCNANSEFVDLQAYMDEVRARPKGSIEPMPKFQPYEAFTYNASGMRSPFQKPVKIDVASQQKGSKDIKPDENRVKQFLEGFNIEVFEMAGTLSDDVGIFGLLQGGGGVYRVKVGDYLGRNHGRIVSVTESKIDVIEIVPDGEGGWLERPRSLALRERS